jgi:hypothetical protein
MGITGQLLSRDAWKRLHPGIAIATALLVAAPWHVLATLRNPPYFAFTLHSGPGHYHGFFWFYFFNEHLLRFLNLRYPRDYNTVPRALFWLLNLVWLFPWSAYIPGTAKLGYSRTTRAGRMRIMALCWIAVVMVFFTFSTTQEYYSMPIYPALAVLLGDALSQKRFYRLSTNTIAIVFFALFAVLGAVFVMVARLPSKGELAQALTQNPAMYSFSLGHLTDLTLPAFAFLKLPLALAAADFGLAAIGLWMSRKSVVRAVSVLTATMIVFFAAAHIAMVRFDNYLGSYPLAQKMEQSAPGQLIECDTYYAFSSVFFYTNRPALLLNGRYVNLEYGSNAPDAPKVFIDDAGFAERWNSTNRYYLLAYGDDLPNLQALAGKDNLHVVAENSGNYLLSNQP